MISRDSLFQSIPSWQLGEEVLSDNVKFRALTHNGEPITLMIENALAPFDSNKWSQLDLRLFEAVENRLTVMQTKIANTYGANDTFKPFLNKKDNYAANIRVKLASTRFWNKQKVLIKAPESLQGSTLDARIWIKGIWRTDACWGVSVHAVDLMIKDEPIAICPF